jgi:hypothetical protein
LLGKDGAYFDISKEYNNLFELPNLQGLEPEIINERLNDFKEFLKSVLMTMVIGTGASQFGKKMGRRQEYSRL